MTIKNELDGAMLSRDPTVGERYLADPLNQHATTTRFGAEALAEQARVRAALAAPLDPDARLPRRGRTGSSRPRRARRSPAVPGVDRVGLAGPPPREPQRARGPDVIADVVAWLRDRRSTPRGGSPDGGRC